MDIAITQNENGAFSLALNAQGTDLATDAGLTTAVILSVFTDRRAHADDVLPGAAQGSGQSANRRGSWHDNVLPITGDLEGARLWLLSRNKRTPDVLARAREYAEEALAWLVDDGIAARVVATADWHPVRTDWLVLRVSIDRAVGGRYESTFNATLQVA